MRRDLRFFAGQQVFLNYPFDKDFQEFAYAMAFGVTAAGLLPLCALDFNSPDKSRLIRLVEAIKCSGYSVHDLSRAHGEGAGNLARMNMPLEMGMALFHAMDSQHADHRCAFVVPTPHAYQKFLSDAAGLDPLMYGEDAGKLAGLVYQWLIGIVPQQMVSLQPQLTVIDSFSEFKEIHAKIAAGNGDGPSHDESREVIYRFCTSKGWWDWRETRAGRDVFPGMPIQWASDPGEFYRNGDRLV